MAWWLWALLSLLLLAGEMVTPGSFFILSFGLGAVAVGGLVAQFGELAKKSNTMVLPATLSDVGSMLTLAMNVIRRESMPAAR
jgi:membrane protein implicated in regulation of membrane protease activity